MPQPRSWRTIPAMNDLAAVDTKPALPQCVINCVVYDQGGKRRDIGLDEITMYYTQHVHLGLVVEVRDHNVLHAEQW